MSRQSKKDSKNTTRHYLEAKPPKRTKVPELGSRVRAKDYMHNGWVEGTVDMLLSKQFRITRDDGGVFLAFYKDEWETINE